VRIAQIAPLIESVPPDRYGGTERVVSSLTEELVRRGHDVTLFATADSITSARLEACVDTGLRTTGQEQQAVMQTVMEVSRALSQEHEFDIIHSHVDYLGLPFVRLSNVPILSTAHGRMDRSEGAMYLEFPYAPLVSISDAQRAPVQNLNWLATVYNGIDFGQFSLREKPGTYLAFLGRASLEKRLDRAIEIAKELDMPLRIAAKVDGMDREYFDYALRPHLDHPLIEFLGEINETEKDDLLGNAYAYLFPIDWPEPFGVTMIEAMACGTPVVATNCGSVPEVVSDGITGFVCNSLREFMTAIEDAGSIDRRECRQHAEAQFSATRMAEGYEAVYRRLLGRSEPAENASVRQLPLATLA
jgi:glycosyltransferase involved in cell wall biosynthesis